jgi:uncharacterized membrane protein YdcZ (DUF606 family)
MIRSAIGVALFVGLAIAIQVAILGRASQSLDPLSISLALQAAGLIVGSVWVSAGGHWDQVGTVAVQWWWTPIGALGWVIVAALGYASQRIGVSTTLAIVVGAQLIAGLMADRLSGDTVFSIRHGLGVLLLIGGATLISNSS